MISFWRNLNVTRRLVSPSYNGAASDFFSLRPRQTSAPCINFCRKSSGKRFNAPLSAEFVARVTGIATMGRLPHQETADGLDAAFVGVPIDTGTSNRSGARCRFSLQLLIKKCTGLLLLAIMRPVCAIRFITSEQLLLITGGGSREFTRVKAFGFIKILCSKEKFFIYNI